MSSFLMGPHLPAVVHPHPVGLSSQSALLTAPPRAFRALSVSLTLDISPARGGDRVTPCRAGQVRQIKKVLYKPKVQFTRDYTG